MMSKSTTFAIRILPVLILVGALAAAPGAVARDGKTYGDPLSDGATLKISELIADSYGYVGKTVKVEGLVTGVCKKRGCWMSLASDEEFQEIRIKVEDGVIVFPYTSMGREAAAEGVFEAIKLTPEQIEARSAAEHNHAEGENCDKSGPKGEGNGAGCDAPAVNEYVYMIRGTGATIKG